MIDPANITKYNRTIPELEELALFCIAVAGKNAATTARNLDKFVGGNILSPFEIIRNYDMRSLPSVLKKYGFGCYNLKAKGFLTIAKSGIDLRACTLEELVPIPGIGFKTATLFLLHTRENSNHACLDVHILKWLSDLGYDVPKQSPQSLKKYSEIENIFLDICKKNNISPTVLDLGIWNVYSKSKPEDQAILDSIKYLS
jgi:thermostable 8-oxoguanine DNA glycosylase